MSFANILSEPAALPIPADDEKPSTYCQKSNTPRKLSPMQVEENGDLSQLDMARKGPGPDMQTSTLTNGVGTAPVPPQVQPRRGLTAQETQKVMKALSIIEEVEMSDQDDVDFDNGFAFEKQLYLQKTKKRNRECVEQDESDRKVCSFPIQRIDILLTTLS